MERSRRITHPTGIEAHIDDRLLDLRQAPPVTIVEQETALGTASVVTQVTLDAPGCFAAFDDMLTLTVQATDGDECHGPFLPQGGDEDKTQCDSNLSPSPLLKHYQRGKGEAGMDAYQVRTWHGWHHHMTLALMAVWFLIGETHRGQQWT